MNRVTLTALKDPARQIVAIKCLREASGTEHRTGEIGGYSTKRMSLRQAKEITDTLRGGEPVTVDVEHAVMLHDCFDIQGDPQPVGLEAAIAAIYARIEQGDDPQLNPVVPGLHVALTILAKHGVGA